MCRTIVSPRVSKRDCIFPLAVMCALRSPISQPPNFNQHTTREEYARWKGDNNSWWPRSGREVAEKKYVSESRGACRIWSARIF